MKIRVFISVPVKDPSVLEPVLSDVGGIRNVKASPLSQMHITMRFIGDVDDGKVKRIRKAVEDAVIGEHRFEVRLRGAGCFPNRKRPSVVWIGVEPEDVLKRISDRISENLRASNVSFDEKPFKGHITIGRCKGPADVEGFLGRYEGNEFHSFTCDSILVMRSELSPAGAKHTVLERIELPM